jgi:TM2 domain-containing membrane protein YozV
MNINKRIYTRSFSQHIILSIAGILLFGVSFTPIAKMHIQYAVNQNLVFSLRYLAVLFLVLGFRGNYPSLKAIHKTIAIFIGIIPTTFLCLATIIVLLSTLMAGCFSFLIGAVEAEFLKPLLGGLLFWVLSASITIGTWLLITRVVFAQYKYPYDLDEQSNLASVSVLLMIFGVFGVHRFFVGRILSGILFLMTMGLLGVGVIVDGIMLMLRRFKDAEGNTI